MPVFESLDRTPLPERRAVRVIDQTLAEGTDSQPSLVRLPTSRQSDFFAPVPLPPTAGVPALSQSPTTIAGVLAGITPETETPSLDFTQQVDTEEILSNFRASTSSSNGPFDEQGRRQAVDSGAFNVIRFAESIAQIESGGRYDAVGPNTRYGTAKGKYQFIDATWRRAAGLVAGANRYPTATSAPNEVQDAVAQAWFESLLQRYDGNYTAVAIAHHAGEGTADRFIRTGQVNTSDVLGTQTSDYARRAINGAFG